MPWESGTSPAVPEGHYEYGREAPHEVMNMRYIDEVAEASLLYDVVKAAVYLEMRPSEGVPT